MYFSLGEVLALLVFGALCVHFLAATRIRELALQHVAVAGKRDDFQLLDQSGSHTTFFIESGFAGGVGEFGANFVSTTAWTVWKRRQGHVIMLGKKLQSVIVSEQPRVFH